MNSLTRRTAVAKKLRRSRLSSLNSRWSKADWQMSNAVVGRKMRVSREKARQMRKLLKRPKATIRRTAPKVDRVMRLVKANLTKLRGLSVARAERLLDCVLHKKTAARRFLDEKRILKDGRRKHPWHRMNFALGNDALARIWSVKSDLVAKHRYRNKGNKAPQRLSFAKPHSRAYLNAIAREKTKAKRLRDG